MLLGVPTATSAGATATVPSFAVVGQILMRTGTSSHGDFQMRPLQQTTVGTVVAVPPAANGSLAELRRLSGLTWDQLARVFGVTRRALHFWASGKPMSPSNEEHLRKVLAVVCSIDRGSSAANSSALLSALDAGAPGIELLARGEYARVQLLASTVSASASERHARMPRRPEELVGALQDTVHQTRGPGRPAASVKLERKK